MTPTDFPILARFPARDPERIQLYSLPSPNGVKVSIMLEELALPYEVHWVPFGAEGVLSAEFIALNPNNKIPAIIDPDGPGGKPIGLWESGAILLYLADKTNQLISPDPIARLETIQWLFWQMGGMGPMFGQLGFFYKFEGREFEDKRPRDRYLAEVRRLLGVLDRRLAGRTWIVDDYSIADIACLGWANTLTTFYDARELSGFDEFANVAAWLERGLARPAVARGIKVPVDPDAA